MDEDCGHSYTALYPKYVKIVQVTISEGKKKGDTLFQMHERETVVSCEIALVRSLSQFSSLHC